MSNKRLTLIEKVEENFKIKTKLIQKGQIWIFGKAHRIEQLVNDGWELNSKAENLDDDETLVTLQLGGVRIEFTMKHMKDAKWVLKITTIAGITIYLLNNYIFGIFRHLLGY